MPFATGKSAKELGINTTRRFVVVDSCNDSYNNSFFSDGDVIALARDDGSIDPFFKKMYGDRCVACDWHRLDYLDEGKIVVHTPTQEDYNILMRAYEGKGWKWCDRDKPTESSYWHIHGGDTSVMLKDEFEYGRRAYYEEIGYSIINLSSALALLKEHNAAPTFFPLLYPEPQRIQGAALTREIFETLSPNYSQPKPTIMSTISQTLKNLALNATDKTLRAHGLENEHGEMTDESRNLMREELTEARWAERREDVAKQLQALDKAKK